MSMGPGSFDYNTAEWYVRSEDGSRYDQTDGNALMNEFGQLLDSGTLHPATMSRDSSRSTCRRATAGWCTRRASTTLGGGGTR